MSKAMSSQNPASTLALRWKRWRFYLSALLLILPLAYLPKYFDDVALSRGGKGLGQRELGELAVGPWSVRLAEWRIEAPRRESSWLQSSPWRQASLLLVSWTTVLQRRCPQPLGHLPRQAARASLRRWPVRLRDLEARHRALRPRPA